MQNDVAGPDGSALSEGLGAWQPIATAPRDGTGILLWQPGIDEPHVGRWSRPPYQEWWGDAWAPPGCQPTHWMPLPAPPVSA
jgi:hypothetical protein